MVIATLLQPKTGNNYLLIGNRFIQMWYVSFVSIRLWHGNKMEDKQLIKQNKLLVHANNMDKSQNNYAKRKKLDKKKKRERESTYETVPFV